MYKLLVVIPNWNGSAHLKECLDSLSEQAIKHKVLVVDNGSTDNSLELLKKYPEVGVIRNNTNKGFSGGINPGFKFAIEENYTYAATLNNDAKADTEWLNSLVKCLEKNDSVGIAASKILDSEGKFLDSTGEFYTLWGLPFPRGRGESNLDKYDKQTDIFAASGGASLYRVSMLEEIGLFDEDFFAYYEDVDLSFRAQLAGWKVRFVPDAVVYHQIGGTSGKMKGFTTYQTMKNLPLLLQKNVPRKYMYRIGWRFTLTHVLFYLRAISRGQFWIATKGDFKGTLLLFSGAKKRRVIQKAKKVSDEYIWDMIIHDLPPNAHALRKLRSYCWKLTRKKV
jgi:hypothetical protein